MTPPPDPPSGDTPPADLPPISPLRRRLFNLAGMTAFATGSVGIVLPLLPTVPFYILAAFCFGKGNPAFERRLLDHRIFGPHIRAWRTRGAISRRGKIAALLMLLASAVVALLFLTPPWSFAPAIVALVTGSWLATRPSA